MLLEIPDYPDKEALFAFMDGLQNWVKMEIERRGAQDLATAISTAESLIEFKNNISPSLTSFFSRVARERVRETTIMAKRVHIRMASKRRVATRRPRMARV